MRKSKSPCDAAPTVRLSDPPSFPIALVREVDDLGFPRLVERACVPLDNSRAIPCAVTGW